MRGAIRSVRSPRWSPAEAQPLDDRSIAADVRLGEIVEEPAPLADEKKQTTTAVVVVFVDLEMLSEVTDALREQRDLDLGRAGVAVSRAVLGNDALLYVAGQSHRRLPFGLGAGEPHRSGSRWEWTHALRACAVRNATYQTISATLESPTRRYLRQQRAGLLDVVSHLGHECIHAVESLHAAQPVYELHPESVPVQIPVKVQEIGLDPALAIVECRIRPNRDGRHPKGLQVRRSAPLVEADDPAGVDAVRRNTRPLVRPEIRGRETELAAALVTAFHQTVETMRPSQRLGGRRHITGLNARADIGGTDRPLGPPQQRDTDGPESERGAELGQGAYVTAGLVPEPEVLPHNHAGRMQVGDQDLVHEPGRGQL